MNDVTYIKAYDMLLKLWNCQMCLKLPLVSKNKLFKNPITRQGTLSQLCVSRGSVQEPFWLNYRTSDGQFRQKLALKQPPGTY